MSTRSRRLLSLGIILLAAILPDVARAQNRTDFAKARDEAVALLRDLVRIDTSNPPGNETQVAEQVKRVLESDGISSQIFALEPSRGNLVARLKGSGSKRPLLLMAHSDVVGVERDKWTVDPFAGTVTDGYLYGRGALDDKAMLAASLEVVLLLKRAGVPLDRDVILLVEAGEEGTTEFGIDFMVREHWPEIDSEFALNEGGGMRLDENGKVRYVSVATTEKVGIRGVRLIARGTSGHGSMPRVDNPVVRLAAAVATVGRHQMPMRLNETTEAYFARLATISSPEEAFLYTHLQDPDLSEMVQEKLRRDYIQANSMLRTSISPNIIKGGFRRNVIPADAEAELDIRMLPDEDLNGLLDELRRLIDDPLVEVVPPATSRPAAMPSRLDSDLFKALEAVQASMFPGAITLPTMLTGATDSAQLRAKGVQAYGLGTAGTEADARAHGNDERVSVAGLGWFVEFLYRTVTAVAVAAAARP
jgi:acetylornithine deacetylase/succinyl-diaminopimelate desuccinylase-like protein